MKLQLSILNLKITLAVGKKNFGVIEMKDEKILKEEVLSDEQLENVAGGTLH